MRSWATSNLLIVLFCLLLGMVSPVYGDAPQPLRAAYVTLTPTSKDPCRSALFLRMLHEQLDLPVDHTLEHLRPTDDLSGYDLLLLTGSGQFHLFEHEKQPIVRFIEKGGMVIAWPGCSSRLWDASFLELIKELYPQESFEAMPEDHPIYRLVFDIHEIAAVEPVRPLPPLHVLSIQDKPALIFSRHGLDETLGEGLACCCCGGYAFRGSARMQVNMVAWLLGHRPEEQNDEGSQAK